MQDIEEIYKKHAKTIYKYVFCLCHDNQIAEEITQETFAIAIKEIKKFKGNCKISVWLCQIAKHLWYKEIKKKKNLKIVSIDELGEIDSNEETIDDEICYKEDKMQLYNKMQMLDEKTKEVIYLRIEGNLSFSEIAEILNKTSNWARVTYYRGKEKIKEELKNEGRE